MMEVIYFLDPLLLFYFCYIWHNRPRTTISALPSFLSINWCGVKESHPWTSCI